MGADIKSLRTRIKSVDSTLHLTKAMGLVASSKIRRATDVMNKAVQYEAAIDDIISQLTSSPECSKSCYMRRSEGNRERIIVIAGDRGLAGGYNANVFRLAKAYPDAEKTAIGKRSCDRYGGSYMAEEFSFDDANVLAKKMLEDFAEEKYDRLGIIYSRFHSMMSQEAMIEWILPIEKKEAAGNSGIIFEPDERTIFDMAVTEYLAGLIMSKVRESFACEIAARKCAMDAAGKNAQEMIDDLQLEYNMARQSSITQEITEIIAGSEV